MNSSEKFTFPFFETICVLDGKIRSPEQHESRYQRTLRDYCDLKSTLLPLLEDITIPTAFQRGRVKLKIAYNQRQEKDYFFSPYPYTPIERLQCIEAPELAYEFKFFDRSDLDALVTQKGDCDDILILQHGKVRDSSYTNICFWTGSEWLTPQTPLLAGTMRAKLLDEKRLIAADISIQDFKSFKGFKLINAMRDFDRDPLCAMDQIRL